MKKIRVLLKLMFPSLGVKYSIVYLIKTKEVTGKTKDKQKECIGIKINKSKVW